MVDIVFESSFGTFGLTREMSSEVRFDSFLSDGFIIAIVVNSPEKKLAKRTSVHCIEPNTYSMCGLIERTVYEYTR